MNETTSTYASLTFLPKMVRALFPKVLSSGSRQGWIESNLKIGGCDSLALLFLLADTRLVPHPSIFDQPIKSMNYNDRRTISLLSPIFK